MQTSRPSARSLVMAACGAVALGVAVVLFMALAGPSYAGDWTNPDGESSYRANGMDTRYELNVFEGPDHCGWQDATFMSLAWPPGATATVGEGADTPARQYVRDPEGVVGEPELRRGFDVSSDLPDDAVDTGFRQGDAQLWLGPDRGEEFVYVASGNDVERWPRSEPPAACV